MSALGNPEETAVISLTASVTTITVGNIGLHSIEFVNMGSSDCYYGKASTLTSDRGAPIFSNGGRRTFESIPSGWVISFRCATGKTTTLRRVNYV